MLSLLFKKKENKVEKKGEKGKSVDTSLVSGVKRLVIDGKEYMVKDVKGITDQFIIIEDLYGNIISIPIDKLKDEEARKKFGVFLGDHRARAVLL